MSLLTRLPEILAIELISSFCDVVDLGFLDNAFCNFARRKDLLNLFQNNQFIVEHLQSGKFQTGSKSSLWMNKRNMVVGKIYLDNPHDITKISSIFLYNISKVNYIRIAAADVNKVTILINQCPNLKYLEVIRYCQQTADSELISKIDERILVQLTEFISHFNLGLSHGVLECLADKCTKLHNLSLSRLNSCHSSCEAGLSKLLMNNPNLRTLHLDAISITRDVLLGLAQYCPLLTRLVMSGGGGRNVSKLEEWVDIIRSLKHLLHLYNNHGPCIEYNKFLGTKSIAISNLTPSNDGVTACKYLFTQIKGFSAVSFVASDLHSESLFELIAENNSETLTKFDIQVETSEIFQSITHDIVVDVALFLSHFKALNTLCLQGFNWVSQEDWVLTANSTGAIQSLVIYGSNTVTMENICCWMEHNNGLRKIKLVHCELIKKAMLKKLQFAAKERSMAIQFEYTK